MITKIIVENQNYTDEQLSFMYLYFKSTFPDEGGSPRDFLLYGVDLKTKNKYISLDNWLKQFDVFPDNRNLDEIVYKFNEIKSSFRFKHMEG